MNVFWTRLILGVCALALLFSSVTATAEQATTSRIVSAANAFLSTLDQKQRQNVLFPFDDAKQRANWSNLPVSFVPRAGLSLGALRAAQRSAALALISSALSTRGFEKVQQIMEGDEALKVKEGNNRSSAKIFITFQFWEILPKKIPGWCSLEATTWRSTSPSLANAACSPRR